MNAASLASLTVNHKLVAIEMYVGYAKAVYSDGSKLIISHANAATLMREHTVSLFDYRSIDSLA